jgi:hypothetical protein
MRKKVKEKSRDFRMAFRCAESFSKFAEPTLDRLFIELNSIPKEISSDQDFANVICAATNLCLSIELYLKSLRIGLGLSVPEHHNLWALCKSLPKGVKDILEKDYLEKVSSTPKGKAVTLRIAFVEKGKNPPTDFTVQDMRPNDMKSLLIRNSNAFTQWRYIYESIHYGETSYLINFEFIYLRYFKNTVRDYIRNNDPKNKSP